jgi:tetratricopeptide (TPR) repeat protein
VKTSASDDAFSLAESLRGRSKYPEALALYEKSLRGAKGQERLRCLLAIADTSRMLGEFSGASRHYEKAVALAKKLHDTIASVDGSVGLALSKRALGDWKSALALLKQALKSYKKREDTEGAAFTLWALAGTLSGIAYSHCGMGNALRMQGNLAGSREHFKRAIALYRRIGDIVSYSYTLWSMGKTYMALGKYSLAEKYLKDALALFRKTKDPRGTIYCRLGIAELRYLAGKTSAAKKLAQSALKEALKRGFKVEACHARAMLSVMDGKPQLECYNRLGLRIAGLRSIPMNMP